MASANWVNFSKDTDSGIETIHAHFEGHAYDPHWHDSYLVGVTQQGLQQFSCRRQKHQSLPGKVFMLEPGEIHDGDAIQPGGFTYHMLYLDPQWLSRELAARRDTLSCAGDPSFENTLAQNPQLALATSRAFQALHGKELRIVRQTALDGLLGALGGHLTWQPSPSQPSVPWSRVAHQAREYLHAHLHEDIGLDQLAAATGESRFVVSRAFKAEFGLPPHAYLIQLKLTRARDGLAAGGTPATVAADLGFADQSHLGRWFRRAYQLTPAHYRRLCTNLPD